MPTSRLSQVYPVTELQGPFHGSRNPADGVYRPGSVRLSAVWRNRSIRGLARGEDGRSGRKEKRPALGGALPYFYCNVLLENYL